MLCCCNVAAKNNSQGEVSAWKSASPDWYTIHSRYSSKRLNTRFGQWFSLIMHDTVVFHVALTSAKTHSSDDILWSRTSVCYACIDVKLIICILHFPVQHFWSLKLDITMVPHFPVLHFPVSQFQRPNVNRQRFHSRSLALNLHV